MILFLKVSYNGSRKINTEYKSQHLCLEETVYKRYRWNTNKKGDMPYQNDCRNKKTEEAICKQLKVVIVKR